MTLIMKCMFIVYRSYRYDNSLVVEKRFYFYRDRVVSLIFKIGRLVITMISMSASYNSSEDIVYKFKQNE